jgi:hypothetical protein
MPTFNVHVYREMRVKFKGIVAETPEAAAKLAAQVPELCEYEYETHDCEGETFSALVDYADPETAKSLIDEDSDAPQSVVVNFEPEHMRRAAPELLQQVMLLADHLETRDSLPTMRILRVREARAVIAKARKGA